MVDVSGTAAANDQPIGRGAWDPNDWVLTGELLPMSVINKGADATVSYIKATANQTANAAATVNVNLHNNYGANADGSGEPLTDATLHLNGHERFREMNGSYFSNVQSMQH